MVQQTAAQQALKNSNELVMMWKSCSKPRKMFSLIHFSNSKQNKSAKPIFIIIWWP